MESIQQDKISIQEGEWIIVVPMKTATLQDLADLVNKLRNPDNKNIVIKAGWALKHV